MSKSLLPVKPYKGTRDFYPEDMRLRRWFFEKMRQVAALHGYEEYAGPVLESFDLYAAKSGTELVNEQIYHFEDKGGRHLAIRPEMTPTVARMVAARLERLHLPLRWFSIANLMRYERPQRGRLREHWQLNMDILGERDVRADLEILTVTTDLLQAFGAAADSYRVRVSNRRFFNEVLEHVLGAGPDEAQTISKAVDRRAKIPREEYEKWLGESGLSTERIALLDELFESPLEALLERIPAEAEGGRELRTLFDLLRATGLDAVCEFDFSIVRGFDYYTGTVFEVYDISPENRRALFGGGRYDNLVGLFKKSEVSGIGFGFGDVTFQDFLETHGLIPEGVGERPALLLATFEEVAYEEYWRLSRQLRERGVANTIFHQAGAKMKKQFQYAERKGFAGVVVLGPEELERGELVFKDMRRRDQQTLSRAEALDIMVTQLNEEA